jgi:endonuclease/exonuclease/phosphatase family metal-dependent hydrolase
MGTKIQIICYLYNKMNETTNTNLRFATLNFLNKKDNFNLRVQSLVEEIKDKDIQIFALQEILDDVHEELEAALFELGFTSCSYGGTLSNSTGGFNGNAIFSKITPIAYTNFDFKTDEVLAKKHVIPAVIAHFQYNNRNVYAISAHFSWGGKNEGNRIRQATLLSEYADLLREEDPECIILLGGDLNAVEQSSTVRYLNGLDTNLKHESTYWVDAWKLHGDENNWATSNPHTYWGAYTASVVGIKNHLEIPVRRIDYIFSYEWCYGRPGYPTSFGRFGEKLYNDAREMSDHYGIYSDIHVPSK